MLHLFWLLFSVLHVNAESFEAINTTSTVEADRIFLHNEIVNPHFFNYLLNPGRRACMNDLLLLVYVHSAPVNVKRRLAIRETWSKHALFKKFRLVFMMGHNENATDLLHYEYDLYGDIVQEDFHDSYRNLTYKGIMAMRWIAEYCSHAKFILKVDDDIIVNTFLLWKHLKQLDKFKLVKERTIMCHLWQSMEVMRDQGNKWYVKLSEYRAREYGSYCSGSAIVMTADLAPLIANMSNYVKFFWVDDYYITGLVPRFLNVTYVELNPLYVLFTDDIKSAFKTKKTEYAIFGHVPEKIDFMYHIWKYIYKQNFYNYLYYNDVKKSDFRFLDEFSWSN